MVVDKFLDNLLRKCRLYNHTDLFLLTLLCIQEDMLVVDKQDNLKHKCRLHNHTDLFLLTLLCIQQDTLAVMDKQDNLKHKRILHNRKHLFLLTLLCIQQDTLVVVDRFCILDTPKLDNNNHLFLFVLLFVPLCMLVLENTQVDNLQHICICCNHKNLFQPQFVLSENRKVLESRTANKLFHIYKYHIHKYLFL